MTELAKSAAGKGKDPVEIVGSSIPTEVSTPPIPGVLNYLAKKKKK